jgi:hypothetical protein
LGFAGNFDALSSADKVLVDRVSVLRLQVDDARMARLRGEVIDTDEFIRGANAKFQRRRAVASASFTTGEIITGGREGTCISPGSVDRGFARGVGEAFLRGKARKRRRDERTCRGL